MRRIAVSCGALRELGRNHCKFRWYKEPVPCEVYITWQ